MHTIFQNEWPVLCFGADRMKTVVEEIYAKVTASRDHKRRMAQEVYDAYEFDCRIESGDPATAWFPTFQNAEVPTMTRKLTVFRDGQEAVTAWFNVEFDKSGTTVVNGYAYVGKLQIFGNLPASSFTLSHEDAPASGWKM
jgi:hypothetical protein